MTALDISTVEVDKLVADIRASFEAAWSHYEDGCRQLVAAHQMEAWIPLGLPNWAAFVAHTLDVDHLKIPKAERQNIVRALSDGGLSVREVAAATGLGVGTVHRELKPGVPNGTPVSAEEARRATDEIVASLGRMETMIRSAAVDLHAEIKSGLPPSDPRIRDWAEAEALYREFTDALVVGDMDAITALHDRLDSTEVMA